MPRHARIILPDCPHHIIQRGHNRQTVFAGDDDYAYYVKNLREWKTKNKRGLTPFCVKEGKALETVDENLAELTEQAQMAPGSGHGNYLTKHDKNRLGGHI